MKYLSIALISFLVISCATSDTSKQAAVTPEDEAIVRNLKTTLLPNAYIEQDTARLNQLLHKDFQLVDDNGDTYTKTDEMEYVGNYGPSYSSFEFEVLRLNVFDNGTAMVFGKGTMKGTDDAGAYITSYKSSDIFIKVEGQWKAISSHVSGVKEERYENAPTE